MPKHLAFTNSKIGLAVTRTVLHLSYLTYLIAQVVQQVYKLLLRHTSPSIDLFLLVVHSQEILICQFPR